jgi:1-acyl-sn-glycerol-3-phosphate acyltransferase
MTTPIAPPRRSYGPAALLMNLTVYPGILLLTGIGIALFPLIFAACRLATGWGTGKVMRWIVWIYGKGWLAIVSPFVSLETSGFEGMGPQPVIYVVNHQSFFDTYFMGALPQFDISFAVRSWPFRMPWYGFFMNLAQYLNVESLAWEDVKVRAGALFASGASILYFPEGHRTRDGNLQRFYSGAFKLAVETGVPVRPLAIDGTGKLLPPGRFWLNPATVTLAALPLFDPSGYTGELAHGELKRDVKQAIAGRLGD